MNMLPSRFILLILTACALTGCATRQSDSEEVITHPPNAFWDSPYWGYAPQLPHSNADAQHMFPHQ
jgi:hypothetical protein